MKVKYCQNCKSSEFKSTPKGIRLWCYDKKDYVGFWEKSCKEKIMKERIEFITESTIKGRKEISKINEYINNFNFDCEFKRKIEQVPESFDDLHELCEKINSKQFVVDCEYAARIKVTKIEFGGTITFHDNGLVVVSPDKDYEIVLTENRTPAQMWQMIKGLIGE